MPGSFFFFLVEIWEEKAKFGNFFGRKNNLLPILTHVSVTASCQVSQGVREGSVRVSPEISRAPYESKARNSH